MRQRPTFSKLQKERARQEKQRGKAKRRLQRKLEKQSGNSDSATAEDSPVITLESDTGATSSE